MTVICIKCKEIIANLRQGRIIYGLCSSCNYNDLTEREKQLLKKQG